ncbi:hypothetical protein SNEBB_011167 [Seison nebaliae]|nr:hypothetical protein SNEBB_011167 [Seison nebaliae]
MDPGNQSTQQNQSSSNIDSSISSSQPPISIPKFSDKPSNFTFSDNTTEVTLSNSIDVTSVNISQQSCDPDFTMTNGPGSPARESVTIMPKKVNLNKRPRNALYSSIPPTSRSHETSRTSYDQGTQTEVNPEQIPISQPEIKALISVGTQTDLPYKSVVFATSTEDITFIPDTEMQDNNPDIIPLSPSQINIVQVAEDNSMKMARDYFGGKPFEGQQKIAAEKFPAPKELKKLAAEDMRKAAYFIFDHQKNEEVKYCNESSAANKPIKINESFLIEPNNEPKFKYLGVNILANGNVEEITSKDLRDMIEKVEKSKLDGKTKFRLMERYGLAKLIFVMENSDQTRAELRRLNGQYRKFVRKINGLRHDFKNEGLHLKPINGGYGATDIEERIARGKYNSASKMVNDQSSKAFSKVVAKSKIPKIRMNNAKYLKISKPEDELDLRGFHQNNLLKRLVKSNRVRESAKPFFNNKRANRWITNDRIQHKYKTDFMKMRYNLMPTRSSTRFFNGGHSRCRGCGGQSESVKHLISKCPKNKGLITLRHNAVIDFLLKIGTRHATEIHKEKTFQTADGIIKPDLITVSNNIAKVFEVAVTFEDDDTSLDKMYKEKMAKYQKHKEVIGEALKVNTVLFEPIILGAAGNIHDKSANSIARNFKSSKFTMADLLFLIMKKSRNMVYNVTMLK